MNKYQVRVSIVYGIGVGALFAAVIVQVAVGLGASIQVAFTLAGVFGALQILAASIMNFLEKPKKEDL